MTLPVLVISAVWTLLTVPGPPGQAQPRLHSQPLPDAPPLDPGGGSDGGAGAELLVSLRSARTVRQSGGSLTTGASPQPPRTSCHGPQTQLGLMISTWSLDLAQLGEPLVQGQLAGALQHYPGNVHVYHLTVLEDPESEIKSEKGK